MAEADAYAGEHIQDNLEKKVQEIGVDVRTGTKGLDLIMEDGKATGIKVESKEGTYDIKADAVIVATGGFSHNKELLAEYAPGAEKLATSNQMGATGDFVSVFKEHDIKIGTIADLINYRIANEQTVEEIETRDFETEYGTFKLYRFREFGADETHLALVKGNVSAGVSTVRVHGFHPLRDLFAAKNDMSGRSGWSVQSALQEISASERGVLVWIGNHQPIDLGDALDKADDNKSLSTITQQPYRSIGVGAQILRHLGVRDMRLLSSPMKFYALSGFDLNVVDFVSAPKLD